MIMARQFTSCIAIGLITVTAAALGCSGQADKPDKQMQEQMQPTLAGPRQGVYLRASFDDDPSHFIGRAPEQVDDFLAEHVAPIRARYAGEVVTAEVHV